MDIDKFHSKYSDADQLKKYAEDLVKIYKSEKQKRKELKDINIELHKAYLETIYRLAIAAEYRDEDTGDHIIRIGRYAPL